MTYRFGLGPPHAPHLGNGNVMCFSYGGNVFEAVPDFFRNDSVPSFLVGRQSNIMLGLFDGRMVEGYLYETQRVSVAGEEHRIVHGPCT